MTQLIPQTTLIQKTRELENLSDRSRAAKLSLIINGISAHLEQGEALKPDLLTWLQTYSGIIIPPNETDFKKAQLIKNQVSTIEIKVSQLLNTISEESAKYDPTDSPSVQEPKVSTEELTQGRLSIKQQTKHLLNQLFQELSTDPKTGKSDPKASKKLQKITQDEAAVNMVVDQLVASKDPTTGIQRGLQSISNNYPEAKRLFQEKGTKLGVDPKQAVQAGIQSTTRNTLQKPATKEQSQHIPKIQNPTQRAKIAVAQGLFGLSTQTAQEAFGGNPDTSQASTIVFATATKHQTKTQARKRLNQAFAKPPDQQTQELIQVIADANNISPDEARQVLRSARKQARKKLSSDEGHKDFIQSVRSQTLSELDQSNQNLVEELQKPPEARQSWVQVYQQNYHQKLEHQEFSQPGAQPVIKEVLAQQLDQAIDTKFQHPTDSQGNLKDDAHKTYQRLHQQNDRQTYTDLQRTQKLANQTTQQTKNQRKNPDSPTFSPQDLAVATAATIAIDQDNSLDTSNPQQTKKAIDSQVEVSRQNISTPDSPEQSFVNDFSQQFPTPNPQQLTQKENTILTTAQTTLEKNANQTPDEQKRQLVKVLKNNNVDNPEQIATRIHASFQAQGENSTVGDTIITTHIDQQAKKQESGSRSLSSSKSTISNSIEGEIPQDPRLAAAAATVGSKNIDPQTQNQIKQILISTPPNQKEQAVKQHLGGGEKAQSIVKEYQSHIKNFSTGGIDSKSAQAISDNLLVQVNPETGSNLDSEIKAAVLTGQDVDELIQHRLMQAGFDPKQLTEVRATLHAHADRVRSEAGSISDLGILAQPNAKQGTQDQLATIQQFVQLANKLDSSPIESFMGPTANIDKHQAAYLITTYHHYAHDPTFSFDPQNTTHQYVQKYINYYHQQVERGLPTIGFVHPHTPQQISIIRQQFSPSRKTPLLLNPSLPFPASFNSNQPTPPSNSRFLYRIRQSISNLGQQLSNLPGIGNLAKNLNLGGLVDNGLTRALKAIAGWIMGQLASLLAFITGTLIPAIGAFLGTAAGAIGSLLSGISLSSIIGGISSAITTAVGFFAGIGIGGILSTITIAVAVVAGLIVFVTFIISLFDTSRQVNSTSPSEYLTITKTVTSPDGSTGQSLQYNPPEEFFALDSKVFNYTVSLTNNSNDNIFLDNIIDTLQITSNHGSTTPSLTNTCNLPDSLPAGESTSCTYPVDFSPYPELDPAGFEDGLIQNEINIEYRANQDDLASTENATSEIIIGQYLAGEVPDHISGVGTCPVNNNPFISLGSLDREQDTGHGSTEYNYDYYSIPTGYVYPPGCSGMSCLYYGFAIDVVSSSNDTAVYAPTICLDDCDLCTDMTWYPDLSSHKKNCQGHTRDINESCGDYQDWGEYILLRSTDACGNNFSLYLNHLTPFTPQNQYLSGDGISYYGGGVSGHIHIEVAIDDVPVRPEDIMCNNQTPPNTNSRSGPRINNR